MKSASKSKRNVKIKKGGTPLEVSDLFIEKWIRDVSQLLISMNNLNFDLDVKKLPSEGIYDCNMELIELDLLEQFALKYKTMAKGFTLVIKPFLKQDENILYNWKTNQVKQ